MLNGVHCDVINFNDQLLLLNWRLQGCIRRMDVSALLPAPGERRPGGAGAPGAPGAPGKGSKRFSQLRDHHKDGSGKGRHNGTWTRTSTPATTPATTTKTTGK